MSTITPVRDDQHPLLVHLWLEGGGQRVQIGTFAQFTASTDSQGCIPYGTMPIILRLYAQTVGPVTAGATGWHLDSLGAAIVALQNGFIAFLHETNAILNSAGLPAE